MASLATRLAPVPGYLTTPFGPVFGHFDPAVYQEQCLQPVPRLRQTVGDRPTDSSEPQQPAPPPAPVHFVGMMFGEPSILRRLAADWIDTFIITFMYMIISGELAEAVQLALGEQEMSEEELIAYISSLTLDTDDILGWALQFSLTMFLYQWLLIAMTSTTIGKMVFRLRVLRDDGSPLGYGLSLLRALIRSACWMFCYFLLLIPLFSRRERRGLYDKLLGTRVWHFRQNVVGEFRNVGHDARQQQR